MIKQNKLKEIVTPMEAIAQKPVDEKIEAVSRVTGRIGHLLFAIQVVGLLAAFGGIIVLIWAGWSLAWRVSLSGVILFAVFKMFGSALDRGVKSAIDRARSGASDDFKRE